MGREKNRRLSTCQALPRPEAFKSAQLTSNNDQRSTIFSTRVWE